MGITGELVRSVFSKSHSIPRHEKRKWSSSVRSYLCGDEHSSLLAADDSASVRDSTVATTEAEAEFASFRTDKSTGSRDACAEEDSSEATVEQPPPKEKRNSTYKLFRQEDAAFIIQSAFRNFMARRRARDDEKAARGEDESIGTSVEVQTGHSYSIKEERDDVRRAIRRRTGPQVLKIQEDWDDSTVSSVISKMRMQHRLEAATRRERALAYAFSQQLRICSKKQSSGGGGDEASMGWSWLERWMAARQPEMHKLMGAMEEKESCGSNEVSSLVEFTNLPMVSLPKNIPKPTNKARTLSLAKRSFSRHNSTSSHLSPKESKDVKKVMWHVEEEKEKRKRQKQPGFNKRDAKSATALQVA